MRRFTAIARTAAIETMSQPLSAILFPVAVLAIHLLPAFQYHRFGAAGRLARETGLSALFVFGLFFAVPAVVRVIGRELETGTAAAALALGVSRSLYFVARLTGTLVVFLLFLCAVAAATALSSFSCLKASTIFSQAGVVRVWGPAILVGVAGSLAPFGVAALLNRFANRRFCLWTCLLTFLFQLPGLALLEDVSPLRVMAPALAALAAACVVYVAMAGALATRLKANGVTACVVAAVAAGFLSPIKFLAPDMRVFWLEEGATSVGGPIVAGVALAALWLLIGCISMERKELE